MIDEDVEAAEKSPGFPSDDEDSDEGAVIQHDLTLIEEKNELDSSIWESSLGKRPQ